MNIIDKNIDKRYNHYRHLKNLKKKSKTEKIVVLLLLNLCIYSYLMPILNAKSSIVIHNAVETVQADELPDPCYLDVVECVGTAVVDREDKPAKGESIGRERIEALIASQFVKDAPTMLAIAEAESGLDPEKESTTDLMSDGRPFSFGLFQHNLTVSNLDGVPCNEAFIGRNYSARVINEKLYQKCVKLAKDPYVSILEAKKKHNARRFQPWGAYTNGSYLKHLK